MKQIDLTRGGYRRTNNFPRHILNFQPGKHLSMRNHGGYTKKWGNYGYGYFVNYKFLEKYIRHNVGKKWDVVLSKLIHRLKANGVPDGYYRKGLGGIIDTNDVDIKRYGRDNEFIVIDGIIQYNPACIHYTKTKRLSFKKDFMRYNLKRLNALPCPDITNDRGYISEEFRGPIYLDTLWMYSQGSYKKVKVYHIQHGLFYEHQKGYTFIDPNDIGLSYYQQVKLVSIQDKEIKDWRGNVIETRRMNVSFGVLNFYIKDPNL